MRDDPAEEGRRPIKIMNDMPVDLTDFLLRRPSAQTLDQVTVNDIRISVICALSAAATNRPRRYALIWQPVLRFLKIPSTNDNVDRFYKRLPAPISDLEKAGVLAVN